MDAEISKTSILDMAMGAIKERVDYEMGRVIDNILDVNTKPNAKRKLQLTLELLPSSDRATITANCVAKSTLVPTEAITTSLYVTSAPGTGELMVAELVPQVPGQLSVEGNEQAEPKVLKFDKQAQA